MFVRLLRAVAFSALLHLISSQRCNISDSELNLQYRTGQIKPKNWPYDFPTDQRCAWTFPNEKFAGKALFIYIKEVNMILEHGIAGDLIIGKELPTPRRPVANCRLYGKNLNEIDISVVTRFVHTRHESRGRYCDAWHIDNRTVETLLFRSYRAEGEDVFKDKSFFIVYDYISVQPEGVTASPPIRGKMETMAPSKSKPEVSSDEQFVPDNCGSFTTLIPIIALATLLVITCGVLIHVIIRLRRLQNKANLTATNNEKMAGATYGADYANAAYASIGNTTPVNPVEMSTPPMYDVPTNNRWRTPTIVSCASSISESAYQVPNSRPFVIDQAISEESNTEGKDLYAVVRKDKGPYSRST